MNHSSILTSIYVLPFREAHEERIVQGFLRDVFVILEPCHHQSEVMRIISVQTLTFRLVTEACVYLFWRTLVSDVFSKIDKVWLCNPL